MLLGLLVSVAATRAVAADCPLPRSAAELVQTATAAEAVWGRDLAAFAEAVATVDATLPCVVEVVLPAQAAQVHRLHGMVAFLRRDMGAANAAFAAARGLDSAYQFPTEMVPPGNPVDTLYRNAQPNADFVHIPAPRTGFTLLLDGTNVRRRNPDVPVVAQVLDPMGRVSAGEWVAEGAALPKYPLLGDGLRAPMLVAGGGAALLGAGLWAFGAATRPDPVYALSLENTGIMLLSSDDVVVSGQASAEAGAPLLIAGTEFWLGAPDESRVRRYALP